jgi:thiamine biosynthesis protein ThiS
MTADRSKITITLNGEAEEIAEGLSLGGLVQQLQLDLRKIAVECNGEIIPRTCHGDTPLSAGDRVEIVEFIGGG